MTLYAYPMDSTGCGMYRVVWPLEAVARSAAARGQRFDHTVVAPGGDAGIQARLDHRREISHVFMPDDCTGVFVQRPTSELLVETLLLLKRKIDVPILVDVDDDMSALSPRHPAFHHLHPRSTGRMPGHSAESIKKLCAAADLVLTSTPALLERYAKHGRGVLLRNRLPEHLVPPGGPDGRPVSATPRPSLEGGELGGREATPHTHPRVSAPHTSVSPNLRAHLRVGWPGSIDTHPDDLSPALVALHRHAVTPLWVIGPRPFSRPSPYSPAVYSGRTEFADWIPSISRHLDIGLAPLEQSPFNEAKSWLKPLELAAAGVPFIASQTPEYEQLGAGLLARKPQHWTAHLRTLLSDPDARHDLAGLGITIARANSYEGHVAEWRSVFEPWLQAPALATAAAAAAL